VGPSTILDAVVKRKIPSPCWESNPDRSTPSIVAIPTGVFTIYKVPAVIFRLYLASKLAAKYLERKAENPQNIRYVKCTLKLK
jgi:hypothetical protein